MRRLAWLCLIVFTFSACTSDSLTFEATPVVVVITPIPTLTPIPSPTDPPTATPPPTHTPTPIAEPSATPLPCENFTGRIEEFSQFRSQIANGENLRYRVYLPPCYVETQIRFPTVYLLHGLSYREEQWEDIGLIDVLDQGIRDGTLPPMVLVMPYLGSLGQYNTFPPSPSYETYILEELLPTIERQICVWQDRNFRAIGGISRGGFWAYSVAFRHPDVFGIVGGHSAYFPNNTLEIPPAFNPLELARDSETLPTADLRLFMDNGTGDSSAQSQQLMSNRLREREIPHTYVINTLGEHNNEYWSQHVDEYLAFYGRFWPKNYSDLPSCD